MKKILVTSFIAVGLAFAGGFVSSKNSNNDIKINSVKEALSAKDDQKITLKGYINKALGDEKYEFRDKDGDIIIIEIDNDDWGNITADENTLLEIYGEVDSELNQKNKIDVDKVKLAK